MATFSPLPAKTEVVEAVSRGARKQAPLEIVGQRHQARLWAPDGNAMTVLDLSRLERHRELRAGRVDPHRARRHAGAEIEAALAQNNQRLGFDPADWGPLFGAPESRATIGGAMSASCDGSAAVRYGACARSPAGFRAVNGFGEAYKGGGKVVKNVTGFDLPKLLCGAFGTLGAADGSDLARVSQAAD